MAAFTTIFSTEKQAVEIARKTARFFTVRGELARFHTKESWLACFPAVWGVIFADGTNREERPLFELLQLLLVVWLSMTLTHGGFCVLNDIIDADIDKNVQRTCKRPLPSGRISKEDATAFCAFVLSAAFLVTIYGLGLHVFKAMLPVWLIAGVYPYTKRVVPWPQFVLAPAVGWPAFAGWIAASPNSFSIEAFPLFVAVSIWTIYFDTCYGLQDYKDDRKVGVKSLALFLGKRYFRAFLLFIGMAVVILLALHAWKIEASPLLWMAGIGVWGASVPLQVWSLDYEKPSTGGRVFGQCINLGLYLT